MSIIIVSFNTKDLLRECIRSVRETTVCINYEIIVVDNASSDGSPEMIEQEFGWVKLLRNIRNLGFAKASNEGARLAKGNYLLFLNSDAVLKERTVADLVGFMEKHNNVAAAGPKILNFDETLQNKGFRFPSITASLLFLTGLDKLLSEKVLTRIFPRLYWSDDQAASIDSLHGCCFLVKKDIFDALGGFSEDYFMYFEEQDWCYRAKQRGFEIWYVPSAGVLHWGSASPFMNRTEVFNESLLLFYKKNIGIAKGLIVTFLQILSAFTAYMRYFILPGVAKKEQIKVYLDQQIFLLRGLLLS
ncbi:MAG TPA: glycosyltransferase family 2 protein [Thermodesulfovibrionales bacterium]|nr:glycosyltransferase family 2 protein [Thermodesulfovibrionales bacterium]